MEKAGFGILTIKLFTVVYNTYRAVLVMVHL